MTIDLYDDVMMPFTIGIAVVMGLFMVGFLIYLIVNESIIGGSIVLTLLFAWLVGFPIWRKHRYG